MRKILRYSLFLLPLLSSACFLYGQSDHFAYVITDVTKEGSNWSYLRKIELHSGSYSDVILSGTDATQLAYDAASKKQMTEPLKDARFGNIANAAFGTGVAAIAYDKRNSRLYYTPMFINQLRYVDLRTMKVYFVEGSDLDGKKQKETDQSNIMTRMAFASDGNGYILSNDGNHLVQFTTGKKINITHMGAVVDDPANKGVSIHNSCSSYGGDMIADDEGNLYVFSARNNIFKINIETKVATYLGTISGLPAQFTTNGVAVDEKGQILLASAVDNSALYTVDHKTWAATPVKATTPWRSADLANSNLLATRKSMPITSILGNEEVAPDGRVTIYPNPVTHNKFSVQFNDLEGNYTLQVTDVTGRQTTQTIVNVKGKGQTESVQLPLTAKQGVYLVKIVDSNNKEVFSRKILVQ